MKRVNDLVLENSDAVMLTLDGEPVQGFLGEPVLSVLLAVGKKAISKNDQGRITGAYCGMGICHSCLVQINGMEKQRACQVEVEDGMAIVTQRSLSDNYKPIKKGNSVA